MLAKCSFCGKDHNARRHRVLAGKKTFCSRKCAGDWKSKYLSGKNSFHWKGGGVERICNICGKPFKIVLSNSKKRGRGKYCSNICKNISISGEGHHAWKRRKIKIRCNICGKEFFSPRRYVEKGITKFCSKRCAGIGTRGENSPHWKNGRTPKYRVVRTCTQYREWRRKVYTRDNFTCVKCGHKKKGIHAHHMKSFSSLLDDIDRKFPLFPIYNVIENYPDLWDISNGITLCKDCHEKEHQKCKNQKSV